MLREEISLDGGPSAAKVVEADDQLLVCTAMASFDMKRAELQCRCGMLALSGFRSKALISRSTYRGCQAAAGSFHAL